MPDLIRRALAKRTGEKFSLHGAYLNRQMVRVPSRAHHALAHR